MAAAEAVAAASPATTSRRRPGLRWLVALLGVVVVIAGSALIVSLAGGRPSPSTAMGYMPASIVNYTEVRLDLPGDQRQKLAAFLPAFPGFEDQSQIEPKINEVFDRIVRAASKASRPGPPTSSPGSAARSPIGQGLPEPRRRELRRELGELGDDAGWAASRTRSSSRRSRTGRRRAVADVPRRTARR